MSTADACTLVTCASACIGASVVRQLVEEGVPVVAFDRSDNRRRRLKLILEPDRAAAVPWVQADITVDGALERALDERHPLARPRRCERRRRPRTVYGPGPRPRPDIGAHDGHARGRDGVPLHGADRRLHDAAAPRGGAGAFVAAARADVRGGPALDLPGRLCAVEEFVASIKGAFPRPRVLIGMQSEPLPFPVDRSGWAVAELVGLLPEISLQEGVHDTVQRSVDLVKLDLLSPPGD